MVYLSVYLLCAIQVVYTFLVFSCGPTLHVLYSCNYMCAPVKACPSFLCTQILQVILLSLLLAGDIYNMGTMSLIFMYLYITIKCHIPFLE